MKKMNLVRLRALQNPLAKNEIEEAPTHIVVFTVKTSIKIRKVLVRHSCSIPLNILTPQMFHVLPSNGQFASSVC